MDGGLRDEILRGRTVNTARSEFIRSGWDGLFENRKRSNMHFCRFNTGHSQGRGASTLRTTARGLPQGVGANLPDRALTAGPNHFIILQPRFSTLSPVTFWENTS